MPKMQNCPDAARDTYDERGEHDMRFAKTANASPPPSAIARVEGSGTASTPEALIVPFMVIVATAKPVGTAGFNKLASTVIEF